MRLRNWLLTGTSAGMLALAPLPALAQSDPLTTAYQAYVAAQQGGDANAIAAAQQALTEQCVVAGYASLDECVAALASGGAAPAAAPPVEEPPAAEPPPAAEEPAPAAEEPAPAAEEPAPAPEQPPVAEPPPAEQPAPEQPAAEQPVPEQPAAEQPAPEEQPAAEEPAPEPPAAEQPAPEQPAPEQPAPEQPAPEQPAPEPPAAERPAPEQPAAEQPAPEEQPVAPPEADPMAAAEAQIAAAVDQYNGGVARLAAGDAGGQAEIDAASATLQSLCSTLGYDSLDACVAEYGLTLQPIPETPAQPPAEEPAPEQPAPQPPANEEPLAPNEEPVAPQPSAEQPAAPPPASEEPLAPNEEPVAPQPPAEQPVAQPPANEEPLAPNEEPVAPQPSAEQPAGEPPAVEQPPEPVVGEDQPVTETAVEPLPETVQPDEAAPLLDSAKQDEEPAADGGAPAVEEAQPPAESAEPAAPPPQSDEEAQAAIEKPAEPQSATSEEGQQVEASAVSFQPPPNVTVINNTTTTINNTTVNNNTTINNNPPADAEDDRGGNDQGRNNRGGNGRPRGSGGNVADLPQFIIQIGTNLVIQSPEQDRRRMYDPDADTIYYEELSRGRVRETIERPNGSKVVTIRARDGSIIRRSRVTADGREYILAYGNDDQDYLSDDWRDPGRDLPPLRLNISARDYVLDADDADEDEVRQFFAQPPVEQVRRIYTINEVKHSARIRDSVRRLEIGNLTFDSGKATISRDQVGALSDVANAMLEMLDRNPGETFLLEGHTDAVGSFESNLVLSDARAATVARILTDFYHVPPENLVTQGYGEQFLKVRTEDDERLNRRVTVRRITPLITIASR